MYLENLYKISLGKTLIQPRFLWFFILSYTMALVSANWFDSRLINVLGLNTGAGALVFPLTYLLSDLITEVYGYKYARLAIWNGFLFNALFLLYGYLISYFPLPIDTTYVIFDSFIRTNTRVIFASVFSYFVAEPVNSYVMAKLKIFLSGKWIGIRFIFSTMFSFAINLAIFCPVAFSGMMSNRNLISFIFTSWIFMISIEIFLLPISVRLTKKIKNYEQLDIYDKRTKFSIFSLNTDYEAKDNKFYNKNKK